MGRIIIINRQVPSQNRSQYQHWSAYTKSAMSGLFCCAAVASRPAATVPAEWRSAAIGRACAITPTLSVAVNPFRIA